MGLLFSRIYTFAAFWIKNQPLLVFGWISNMIAIPIFVYPAYNAYYKNIEYEKLS